METLSDGNPVWRKPCMIEALSDSGGRVEKARHLQLYIYFVKEEQDKENQQQKRERGGKKI